MGKRGEKEKEKEKENEKDKKSERARERERRMREDRMQARASPSFAHPTVNPERISESQAVAYRPPSPPP